MTRQTLSRSGAIVTRAAPKRSSTSALVRKWALGSPQLNSPPPASHISYSREAKARYLAFATSPAAQWPGNFRDLGASITRMATLAEHGQITVAVVDEEIDRLQRIWGATPRAEDANTATDWAAAAERLGERWSQIDRFDQAQLAEVLRVCRRSRSLSEAGRLLFQASRARKQSSNDADRLRKYLARFDLSFDQVVGVR